MTVSVWVKDAIKHHHYSVCKAAVVLTVSHRTCHGWCPCSSGWFSWCSFLSKHSGQGGKACRQTLRFTSNGLYSCPEVLEQSATKLLKVSKLWAASGIHIHLSTTTAIETSFSTSLHGGMVGPCGLHNWSTSRTENEWLIVPSMAALLYFYSGDMMI